MCQNDFCGTLTAQTAPLFEIYSCLIITLIYIACHREDRTLSEMYSLEYQEANGTSTIEFNLCEETARRCPDLMADHANIINSNNTCNHLSRVYMDGE